LTENAINCGSEEVALETFADLPDALVRDLLEKAIPVAEAVNGRLDTLRVERAGLRDQAQSLGLILRKTDLDVPREPSVVGIDGSYQIHHLTALDLCATAAVAVEGTSKEAKRHWPQPYHDMWVDSVPHEIDTIGVLRGMMISMELCLAHKSPHDLVLLDGSFTSLVIYVNQALQNLRSAGETFRQEFLNRWTAGLLPQLLSLLRSDRTLAVPKFTSRNEFLRLLSKPPSVGIDGKTLATLLLNPGEYTRPTPTLEKDETYHLLKETDIRGRKVNLCSDADVNLLNASLKEVHTVYFRPYGWLPAVRLELPGTVANSNARLSLALEGIARQFFSPAVIEPYPLFLADRMVKSLGAGVAVIEQAVAQQVASQTSDLEISMLCLQNYRTEGGRGGV
jgi:hypothetical protein